jgi:hypothetical protein
MKISKKLLTVMAVLGVAGLAWAVDTTAVYVKSASTTVPTSITDGFALNYAAPGTGTPVTRIKTSLQGAGDIVSGRINYYRWIPDAGWTREPGLDQLIADGGYPGGGGFNLMGNTLPEQNITVTGNSQRLDAVAINILQGDGGTAVPVIYIQSTVR